ncbi:hypothetical protein VNO77_27736 [Canavalia gladiata]|uniref:Uncharacterized protein n=1 Tax=Canavalia gladiata TaxID=3824 RepID=A0AAN9KUJ8_CANGL
MELGGEARGHICYYGSCGEKETKVPCLGLEGTSWSMRTSALTTKLDAHLLSSLSSLALGLPLAKQRFGRAYKRSFHGVMSLRSRLRVLGVLVLYFTPTELVPSTTTTRINALCLSSEVLALKKPQEDYHRSSSVVFPSEPLGFSVEDIPTSCSVALGTKLACGDAYATPFRLLLCLIPQTLDG